MMPEIPNAAPVETRSFAEDEVAPVCVGVDLGSDEVTLRLLADVTGIGAIVARASALAGLSRGFREALQALIDRGEKLLCVESDPLTAVRAGEVTLRVLPSQALADLLSADWASDRQGDRPDV